MSCIISSTCKFIDVKDNLYSYYTLSSDGIVGGNLYNSGDQITSLNTGSNYRVKQAFLVHKNDNSILSLKNVEIISGEFGSQNFTDKDLNTLYNKASLSIIPLISGIQPSGQSVAQQSLAVGVPVLITKTDGFWTDLFTIDEGIYMVDENHINTWTKKIEEILSKKNNQISNESQEIIKSNFSVEKFNKTLESLIIDR